MTVRLKSAVRIAVLILSLLLLAACNAKAPLPGVLPGPSSSPATKPIDAVLDPATETQQATTAPMLWVNPEGDTVETRILVPNGFVRKEARSDSFAAFLRKEKLEPDGSPVLLYDGTPKGNQNVHVAVFSIDVGTKDRQQCADAALRLRAEFLFAQEQYDKISFHLTNGFLFPYAKYRDGYRLKVDGNDTSLVKSAQKDTSYAVFRKYCDLLFAYAGTISVSKECTPIEEQDLAIGDVFVYGGSPGHCVIVVDVCQNVAGEKAFLLAQSYMPAQQIHILKNPAREEPWYYASELSYPFETPQWTFEQGSLKRFPQ